MGYDIPPDLAEDRPLTEKEYQLTKWLLENGPLKICLRALQLGDDELNMKNNYTAIVEQDSGRWIGWIKDVPSVNCQELTWKN